MNVEDGISTLLLRMWLRLREFLSSLLEALFPTEVYEYKVPDFSAVIKNHISDKNIQIDDRPTLMLNAILEAIRCFDYPDPQRVTLEDLCNQVMWAVSTIEFETDEVSAEKCEGLLRCAVDVLEQDYVARIAGAYGR